MILSPVGEHANPTKERTMDDLSGSRPVEERYFALKDLIFLNRGKEVTIPTGTTLRICTKTGIITLAPPDDLEGPTPQFLAHRILPNGATEYLEFIRAYVGPTINGHMISMAALADDFATRFAERFGLAGAVFHMRSEDEIIYMFTPF